MFRYHGAVKFLASALVASFVLAAAPTTAQPRQGTGTREGASINGVDQANEIDCQGRPAEVSGSGNRINFVGDCPSLTVNGVDNQIGILLPPGADLRVSGVDNVVTWQVRGKGKPRISVQGVDNQVRPSR
ncbi:MULTISPECIES: DUF3060 domain-containing protein [unclassified Sphingopyxis]|uniref:DUF3060 domain-containing protein n=1 Tax=unclassified Sphingopyxis TaxID=2614943 RepID=UPI0006BF73B3|nr:MULTISPECIES: DUF3060 domain-containing protein [unclassified Sphingopyxis]USI77844.1 DUF3060 domain-containing protein [Sphingopyxis sp. USTB-05]GAO79794.1 hypothetical protein SC1_03115 [Sphingopyxis sp. C-1]